MNKQKMNDILDLHGVDYIRGIAEVSADYQSMQQLQEAELLDMDVSYADGPTMAEVMQFLNKYHDRGIELRLLVIDPQRDDFRISMKAISIAPEQARINNDNDMLFWIDWMNLGKIGCVSMVENNAQISWEWYKS